MKNMYSIYDRVSNQFLDPQPHVNDDAARRAFMMSCADPAVPELYLRDIELSHIGVFDETTGEIVTCRPRQVMNGNSPAILELRTQYMEVIRGDLEEKRDD